MSPTRARGLQPTSTPSAQLRYVCDRRFCMVTILASHDRIFYILAPLLHWLLPSRELIFTVQGSRTACIARSLTHTSEYPVRNFLHRMYVSSWEATPLMLPSRPSPSKAWPTILPHFVPASILQDNMTTTYRLMLLLFGHVVGQFQGVYFLALTRS